MEQQIIVSCLGRPLEVGMLYDCRNETAVPGITLWDLNTLRSNSDIYPRESSEYEIIADDSTENKAHKMNIEAEVKLSFLGGLVKAEGSAKYLDNKKTSAYQARIVMKYSCKSSFKQLSMNHLGVQNIQYPDIFDKDVATHVVTGIEYGADAYFIFDKQEKTLESCNSVEGEFKLKITSIPTVSVDAKAKLEFSEEEKAFCNSFKCTFLGDIVMKQNPTTFQEAIEIYKNLPQLIREVKTADGIYGVPKKVYLYPLSKLDSKASKLVRMISDDAINQVQSVLEHVSYIIAQANDLENSRTCQKLFDVKMQIVKFKSAVTQFRSSFQRVLCEILPKIRGGGKEESELLKFVVQLRKSPFDPEKLDAWIAIKKREFSYIESFLAIFEQTNCHLAFQPGELERFTQDFNRKYAVCISLDSIIQSNHPFLDVMQKFSFDKPIVDDDGEIWKSLEGGWCDDDDLLNTLRNQVRLFTDTALHSGDVKFVVMNAKSKKQTAMEKQPGTIFLFENGIRRPFYPPSSPGQPRKVDVGEDEITVSWSAPTTNPESVSRYKIFYRPAYQMESDKWDEIATENARLQFTVKGLKEKTRYILKVKAATEATQSPAGPECAPIETVDIKNFRILKQLLAEDIANYLKLCPKLLIYFKYYIRQILENNVTIYFNNSDNSDKKFGESSEYNRLCESVWNYFDILFPSIHALAGKACALNLLEITPLCDLSIESGKGLENLFGTIPTSDYTKVNVAVAQLLDGLIGNARAEKNLLTTDELIKNLMEEHGKDRIVNNNVFPLESNRLISVEEKVIELEKIRRSMVELKPSDFMTDDRESFCNCLKKTQAALDDIGKKTKLTEVEEIVNRYLNEPWLILLDNVSAVAVQK